MDTKLFELQNENSNGASENCRETFPLPMDCPKSPVSVVEALNDVKVKVSKGKRNRRRKKKKSQLEQLADGELTQFDKIADLDEFVEGGAVVKAQTDDTDILPESEHSNSEVPKTDFAKPEIPSEKIFENSAPTATQDLWADHSKLVNEILKLVSDKLSMPMAVLTSAVVTDNRFKDLIPALSEQEIQQAACWNGQSAIQLTQNYLQGSAESQPIQKLTGESVISGNHGGVTRTAKQGSANTRSPQRVESGGQPSSSSVVGPMAPLSESAIQSLGVTPISHKDNGRRYHHHHQESGIYLNKRGFAGDKEYWQRENKGYKKRDYSRESSRESQKSWSWNGDDASRGSSRGDRKDERARPRREEERDRRREQDRDRRQRKVSSPARKYPSSRDGYSGGNHSDPADKYDSTSTYQVKSIMNRNSGLLGNEKSQSEATADLHMATQGSGISKIVDGVVEYDWDAKYSDDEDQDKATKNTNQAQTESDATSKFVADTVLSEKDTDIEKLSKISDHGELDIPPSQTKATGEQYEPIQEVKYHKQTPKRSQIQPATSQPEPKYGRHKYHQPAKGNRSPPPADFIDDGENFLSFKAAPATSKSKQQQISQTPAESQAHQAPWISASSSKISCPLSKLHNEILEFSAHCRPNQNLLSSREETLSVFVALLRAEEQKRTSLPADIRLVGQWALGLGLSDQELELSVCAHSVFVQKAAFADSGQEAERFENYLGFRKLTAPGPINGDPDKTLRELSNLVIKTVQNNSDLFYISKLDDVNLTGGSGKNGPSQNAPSGKRQESRGSYQYLHSITSRKIRVTSLLQRNLSIVVHLNRLDLVMQTQEMALQFSQDYNLKHLYQVFKIFAHQRSVDSTNKGGIGPFQFFVLIFAAYCQVKNDFRHEKTPPDLRDIKISVYFLKVADLLTSKFFPMSQMVCVDLRQEHPTKGIFCAKQEEGDYLDLFYPSLFGETNLGNQHMYHRFKEFTLGLRNRVNFLKTLNHNQHQSVLVHLVNPLFLDFDSVYLHRESPVPELLPPQPAI